MRSSNVKTAFIRADAGAALGGGHVARCLALANRLRQSGWNPIFATRAETLDVFPALGKSFPLVILSGSDEAAELRHASPAGCDLLIVDHYQRDAMFEGDCRPWARTILAIDDLANRRHDADFLLDQTPGRQPNDYAALVAPSCRLLMGADYALLRPEFARLRQVAHCRETSIGSILITFGASDPHDMSGLAVEALITSSLQAQIDVVVGRDYPNLVHLQARTASSPLSFTFHCATDRIADLMAKADLCIGAAGITALERCCLGLPSVVIRTAENQATVAAELASAGAIFDLGLAGTQPRMTLLDRLRTAINDFFNAPEHVAAMSRAAAVICDGRGTWRALLALLTPKITTLGQTVILRLADIADAPLLFCWQTAPDIRRYFRQPRPPEWQEHLDWTARTLSDPNNLLFIAEVNGIPSAMVRLDRLEGPVEVSLLVAPDCQSRGIGKTALLLASELLPKQAFQANIHSENLASQRLFLSAGYRPLANELYELRARIL